MTKKQIREGLQSSYEHQQANHSRSLILYDNDTEYDSQHAFSQTKDNRYSKTLLTYLPLDSCCGRSEKMRFVVSRNNGVAAAVWI